MPEILTDADVTARLTPAAAIDTIRSAVLAAHRGELAAPPRAVADLDAGRLLITAGRWRGRWYGYRAYDTFRHDSPNARNDQLVGVHDDATGRLVGLVVGAELGRRRTGALGAVAVDALAPAAATTLGLIGTGSQAWTQLWAVSAVRRLDAVWVYSRDERHRRAFVDRAASELRLPAEAAASARDAVDEAEIVVLATSSPSPVVDTAWLAPNCHVTTLGPKQRGRAEFRPDLLDTAGVLATDSVPQLNAYDPPALAGSGPHAGRVVDLGSVLAGDAPVRTSGTGRTVYLSVGLAGTEVALAASLLS